MRRATFLFACLAVSHGRRVQLFSGLEGFRKEVQNAGEPHFDCESEASNWNLAWSPLKKKWCCRKAGVACEIFNFDGSGTSGEMTVSRQGERLYRGEPIKYSFDSAQLNKEFVTSTDCEEAIFVRRSNSKMCGVKLFSAKRLTCSPVDMDEVNKEVDDLRKLAPKTERGFSLEFEFAARPVTDDLKRRRYEELMSSQQYPQHSVVNWLHSPPGEISCLYACAKQVMADLSNASLTPKWEWVYDSSVHPLSPEEVASINASKGETKGVGFEVNAPGPPHVLSGGEGLRSVVEILAVTRHMGVQSGPSSSVHIHVNVMNPTAPGDVLPPKKVAYIWAAYAKYQLVIDEMLSPSRPGNSYASRLFLSDCKVRRSSGKCHHNQCGCLRRFFNQMHAYLKEKTRANSQGYDAAADFCNAVMQTPGSERPCEQRHPHQRYFQLNLAALQRHGTIEFRAHSATSDAERILRYTQFITAFVEYFGIGKGVKEMQDYFSSSSADNDYLKLVSAQRQARPEDLFPKLASMMDEGSVEYFSQRVWEKDDPTCHTSKEVVTIRPDCQSEANAPSPAVRHEPFGSFFSGWPGFSLAEVKARSSRDKHIARVAVPSSATPGSYLHVMMPEGDVRAEQVSDDAVLQGYHEFAYNPRGHRSLESYMSDAATDDKQND